MYKAYFLLFFVVSFIVSFAGSASAQGGGGGAGSCPLKNDLFLNPFKADSAHHRPIGTGAQYAADNHATTLNILKNQNAGITLSVGAPWGVYMVKVGASDPLVSIDARPPACDAIRGFPASIRLPGGKLQLKVAANKNGCPDGNIGILDTVTGVFHHLRQYEWNNGKPRGGQHIIEDLKGLGHGVRPGDRVGTSAAGVATAFGLIRGREINTPGMPIRHAMQISLPRRVENPCEMMLSREFQLPAVGIDRSAKTNMNDNLGTINYGSLFALPPESESGPNINSLGLGERGKRLAEAFRNYGAYAVDGTSCPHMRTDQDVANPGELNAALKKIYPHLRIVLNGAWTPNQSAVGGGTPLAPSCAFDAP